ncbi:unnamed protein product, partial [Nesidiocoris tenuis]
MYPFYRTNYTQYPAEIRYKFESYMMGSVVELISHADVLWNRVQSRLFSSYFTKSSLPSG